MPIPAPFAIAQFARLVGRARLLAVLGLPLDSPVPVALDSQGRTAAQSLARADAGRLSRALADEARVSDDVRDADSATGYIDARLEELRGLIPEDLLPELRRSAIASIIADESP